MKNKKPLIERDYSDKLTEHDAALLSRVHCPLPKRQLELGLPD